MDKKTLEHRNILRKGLGLLIPLNKQEKENKMKTTELRPQTTKGRSIEWKVLIPYTIITIMIVTIIALIGGWQLRGEMDNHIITSASNIAAALSKTSSH